MSVTEILLIVLVVGVLIVIVLQVMALLRGRTDAGLTTRLDALKDDGDRLQRSVRDEQRAGREELQQGFDRFRGHVVEQLGGMSQQQGERIDGFGSRLNQLTERTDTGLQSLSLRLAEDARKSREESALTLARFGELLNLLTERTDAGLQALSQRLTEEARRSREESTLTLNRFGELLQQRLDSLTADNEKRMGEVRSTLETKLGAMQQDNAAKLEQMRATVDEKLQSTLETRLGQSFKLVSERLEAVQRGLGEMQSLANGVGDLKRVLTNVKRRGILGEVQLGGLLEDLLTNEQYAANVATVPGSSERVEYAIRMPGQEDGENVYLPIDSKFPTEDYQRLLDAQDAADVDAAALAGRALEVRVRDEAKRIKAKYVATPHTTDFAVLFLPTEGLYAEVLRRPGLFESLQRDHRVMVAGPTTLSALLNSLQMGFRTLAIAKRSSEVWKLLGVVKSEFGKFGLVLEKAERQLNTVSKSISDATKKTKTIERKLRGVESLAIEDTTEALGLPLVDDVEDADGDAEPDQAT